MDVGRVIVTAIIWVSCLAVVLTNIIMNGSMILTMFSLFMAVIGMIPIWEQKTSSSSGRFGNQYDNYPTKAKNESTYEQKMRLLMELMDEDERQAFKDRLKAQITQTQNRLSDGLMDGELPFDAEEYEIYDRK